MERITKSPWASPTVPVLKKDPDGRISSKDIRLAIDYRRPNTLIKQITLMMPVCNIILYRVCVCVCVCVCMRVYVCGSSRERYIRQEVVNVVGRKMNITQADKI